MDERERESHIVDRREIARNWPAVEPSVGQHEHCALDRLSLRSLPGLGEWNTRYFGVICIDEMV